MDQQHRRFLRHAIGWFGEVLRGIQRDSRSQHIGVTVLGHGVLQGEAAGFPLFVPALFQVRAMALLLRVRKSVPRLETAVLRSGLVQESALEALFLVEPRLAPA